MPDMTDDATTSSPEFPDRPDHPDFAWLSEHVQALDAKSEAPDFNIAADLATLPIDVASLIYLAENRAQMAMAYLVLTGQMQPLPRRQHIAARTAMASTYMDAFVLGAEYGRHLTEGGR